MSDYALGRSRSARSVSPSAYGKTLWATFKLALRARKTRRYLADLDDRMLADVGIGRGDALMEQSRSMWDVTPRGR